MTTTRLSKTREALSALALLALAGATLHTGYAIYSGADPLWERLAATEDLAERFGTSRDDTVAAAPDGDLESPDDVVGDAAAPAEDDAAAEVENDDVAPGYDHAAEVEAAVSVLTVNDDGTAYPTAARWSQDTVTVRVGGAQADEQVRSEVGEVLAWLTEVTGVQFVLTDQSPDVEVTVEADKLARARQYIDGGDRVVEAWATWNTSYERWRLRWMWEELVHVAGPVGDYGPEGTLFNSDMQAGGPTEFDRWMLTGLYQTDDLTPAGLRAWYEANPRQ